MRQRSRRCAIPAPTLCDPSSIAFDRAAGYYDQTRGFPAEVSERIADVIERTAGVAGESGDAPVMVERHVDLSTIRF